MTVAPKLQQAIAAARRRAVLSLLGVALPLVAAGVLLLWRFAGVWTALVAAGVLLPALAIGVRAGLRVLDVRWIGRRLDRDPALQDSADLLFRDPAQLGPLQRLQRERLDARLQQAPPADLRLPWPRRGLLVAWATLAATAVLVAWPLPPTRLAAPARPDVATTAAATHTALVSAQLTITPPAYTGVAAVTQADLSAKAPVGSRVAWRLRLQPQPAAVRLAWHDGTTLDLTREGDDWIGEVALQRPRLYRLQVADGLPLAEAPLQRLQPVADRAPRLRVIAPERSLNLRTDGQRTWPLQFEASDDYGLGAARLRLTMTKGSGEQVEVSESSQAVRGEGSATQRTYSPVLDLAALGMAEGDDLIVRLEVDDNRADHRGAPSPQRARSASVILRWPPPASSESTGMEGLVKRALPAYFRSQRQIIIDTEALIGERPQLAADDFAAKSDTIAVDQRILRMRYGEFLGEENEGGRDAGGEDAEHAEEPPQQFGTGIDALSDYGHTHDDAEAATLLDPQTRALLKSALDAMWQSEGALRTGNPQAALPHQYRALAFIKQVQQATRIYLARVGLELPPIDETRRMTGKRDGLGDRRDGLLPATVGDSPALQLWQALAAPPADAAALAAFATWLETHEDAVADPVELLAALAELQAAPDCVDCATTLRARLWPLIPPTVPAAAIRAAADREGRAYLDALPADAAEAPR